MLFKYLNKNYTFNRYPSSKNKSLKPWSAADEHTLEYLKCNNLVDNNIIIYNDRFAFLTCLLNQYNPITVISYKSQEKASLNNLLANKLSILDTQLINPLSTIEKPLDICIIKIPKSLELFRLFLYQISQKTHKNTIVICSFMTRHFSSQLISIASEFYNINEQSTAWKKSRLLILKKPKVVNKISITNIINVKEGKDLKQFFGVFSAKHIDYGSQFFIQHLVQPQDDLRILDLGAGNGILAREIRNKNRNCELHLIDDFYLAVESSKLNLSEEKTFFHYDDNLSKFQNNYFNYIISNPPFHFEYEINSEISINLFKEVHRCLINNGHFQLVANKHLNYKTHLNKIFSTVKTIAQNDKFIIYDCIKGS
ncbi:MAG: methyltransferase [Saprospiraceae bacterium]|nr:methyltransferase [Saprospiraceae bacterium]